MNLTTLSEQIETISANYAKKFGFERTPDWFILKLQEEVGELIQAYLQMRGQARRKEKSPEELTEQFHKEIADVLGQLLLLAKQHGVDVEEQMEEKWLVWVKK